MIQSLELDRKTLKGTVKFFIACYFVFPDFNEFEFKSIWNFIFLFLCLRCQPGYIGARCEYLDLDWRIGEKREIIIACIIAGLVLFILLIVFICMCSQ